MRTLFNWAIFVLIIGTLTIATGALAQRAADSPDIDKARAPIAHLSVTSKSIAFGVVKRVTTKSIKIKNTGTVDANVIVAAPAAPFSITDGAGTYSLTPGQVQSVSVQFAPSAAGKVEQPMAIQCTNCNTAVDDDIVIHLSGNARAPIAVPTPTAISPTVAPTPSPVATPTAAPTVTPTATPTPSTANALPLAVTAGPFGDGFNEPFAAVTICATGTSNCTTVNDVLIDTGSFGLRIFGSQLSGLGITPNPNGGSELGECAFFGSGSTWGSVSTVDVKIAGEPTMTIPIQVIDDIDAFAPAPRDCTQGTQLLSSPSEVNFNGLLGIGQVSNDVIFTDYFDCAGEDCSPLGSPPTTDIVVNPVASFPVDNNGVVVSLSSVPTNGQESAEGTLYFGIGTEANNQPGTVQTYLQNSNTASADYLDINTIYKGQTAGGFFDTGSDGYFFNDNSISQCDGWYCPLSTLSESATNESVGSSVSGSVSFEVGNANSLLNTDDTAFPDLAGTLDGGETYDGFDWGLPFFFGRTVYLGMVGSSSSLGVGPYTAY